MKPLIRPNHLRTRIILPLALGLAWGVFFAPGPLWAGCSHYAISRVQPPPQAQGLELLFGIEPTPTHHVPADPRRPCAGPQCSEAPNFPGGAVAPSKDRDGRWAVAEYRRPSSGQQTATVCGVETSLHPLHIAGTIFRPPRQRAFF